MKQIRFTEEQIIAVLREHKAVQRRQIWHASTGSRKPRYTTGRPSMAGSSVGGEAAKGSRGGEPEAEEVIGESMLDNAALKQLLTKRIGNAAGKREAVARLRGALEMSERRACDLIAADRTMVRYR
jgi:hypothetical protein